MNEEAGAITGQRVRAHRTTMRQIGEYLEPLFDDGVAFAILDISDKADAAGIVVVGRIVEPRRSRHTNFVHHAFHSQSTGTGSQQGRRILRPNSHART